MSHLDLSSNEIEMSLVQSWIYGELIMPLKTIHSLLTGFFLHSVLDMVNLKYLDVCGVRLLYIRHYLFILRNSLLLRFSVFSRHLYSLIWMGTDFLPRSKLSWCNVLLLREETMV